MIDDSVSILYTLGSLCFLVGTLLAMAHRHGLL